MGSREAARRNSWGPYWGEADYLKTDKRLASLCLDDGGSLIATDVDGSIKLNIYHNHLNQRQVVGLLMSATSDSESNESPNMESRGVGYSTKQPNLASEQVLPLLRTCCAQDHAPASSEKLFSRPEFG